MFYSQEAKKEKMRLPELLLCTLLTGSSKSIIELGERPFNKVAQNCHGNFTSTVNLKL